MRSLQPYALSLLRIVAGFTFSLHGFQKLFGLFGGIGGSGAHAQVLSLLWVAGLLETFGGVLIILGLFTCPVAFIVSGEMAGAGSPTVGSKCITIRRIGFAERPNTSEVTEMNPPTEIYRQFRLRKISPRRHDLP